jgi:hypothetical protein
MPPKLRLVDEAFMAERARARPVAPKAARRPAPADTMLLARLDRIEAKLVKAKPGVRWHDLAGLAVAVGTAAHLGILTGHAFF